MVEILIPVENPPENGVDLLLLWGKYDPDGNPMWYDAITVGQGYDTQWYRCPYQPGDKTPIPERHFIDPDDCDEHAMPVVWFPDQIGEGGTFGEPWEPACAMPLRAARRVGYCHEIVDVRKCECGEWCWVLDVCEDMPTTDNKQEQHNGTA